MPNLLLVGLVTAVIVAWSLFPLYINLFLWLGIVNGFHAVKVLRV